MVKNRFLGYLFALASAALVGLFTVLNKWLLVEDVPALTAGAWTYFAAGLALLPWALRYSGLNFKRPLAMMLWLLAGSVFGPSLYFVGLLLTSGVEGVLLINIEAVFTAFLAFAFFKERLSGKTIFASVAIIAGAVWMSWSGTGLFSSNALGNLLIALGYLGWATENNFGRLLGEDIPAVTLVCVKALVAGVVMGILAVCYGQPIFVSWHVVPGIVASGAISLGLSLAFFYIAMRHIGAARTGLISSTSTLWGVIGAVLLIGESLTQEVIIGGILMIVGISGFALDEKK
ncbi:DMT family transporter [Paenibacillus alginolyticus]|uniref:DMT family transporter n=1 Tax=Paenibacillus alginolyticus TaxID=59839 RepID=UPI000419FAF1|nr:DMT family transporter [Paenibacillus alginolyticus]MCY9667419.1 DMT family transporter [Paenibacillus alginolyticus]